MGTPFILFAADLRVLQRETQPLGENSWLNLFKVTVETSRSLTIGRSGLH